MKYYKKETKKKKYFRSFDYGFVMMPSYSFGGKSNSITYKYKLYPFNDYISKREYSFSTAIFKRLNHMYCETNVTTFTDAENVDSL
uniref:Metalloendopeptidase n=1 Tax=Strongyloides venezuelensis TaxID=75913 RepID=A0A0K0FR07_STRVS